MILSITKLLAEEEHWTQRAFARTKTGRVIGPYTKGAACWCLEGAVYHVTKDEASAASFIALRGAVTELFPERGVPSDGIGISIAAFNDHPDTTHADVLRVLARAQELEQARS
jgi:hypothetical protein